MSSDQNKVAKARKLDLASTFAVLDSNQLATLVDVTPTIYEELDERFDGFKGRLLVSCFGFESDWSTWERHPAGDEIVCLLSGDVRMVLDRDGVEDVVHLRDPGTYIVVPKGTWHTARTSVTTKMLFITPGEGTENKTI